MSKLLSFPNLIVFILLIAAGSFMLNAAISDSAILDEPVNIVAGYMHLKHLNYRFNSEDPPLVKILAGAPLLFQNLNFSTDDEDYGNQFLYESGNNADRIIFWARIVPILLTILSILFVYFWAKELIGRSWALLPTFLFSLSPIVLAHGHYVTTDIGATLGILLSIYFFLRYLQLPSNKNLLLAGIAFGLAQSIKFSSISLIPYLFLIAGIFALISKKNISKYLFYTVIVMVIGYAVIVYPLYLLTTEGRLVASYFEGASTMFQPAIDNAAFFLGELSASKQWYYLPLIYLMKESLPVLALIFLGLGLTLLNMADYLKYEIRAAYRKFIEYTNVHFTEFSMMVFIAFYWLVSMSGRLNISGDQHVLPTIPLIYILTASVLRKWFAVELLSLTTTPWERFINFLRKIFNFWAKTFILSLLVIWLIMETTLAAPHFLSYFNELAGWRMGGFQYAVDSDFDLGQDLKRLEKWVTEYLEPDEKIAVDYFGGANPKYYLGKQFVSWQSAKGNPKEEGIEWLAVSATTLQKAIAKTALDLYRNPTDEYRWLENPYQPTDRAGTSIFIYKLNKSTDLHL